MIHILVVDDDEKLTQSICSYLNNCGYEAKGMLSAESAYDEMYSSLYDLIISDIMMPGTDGFAFAETIRRLNKRIPILFVSARDDLSFKEGVRSGDRRLYGQTSGLKRTADAGAGAAPQG